MEMQGQALENLASEEVLEFLHFNQDLPVTADSMNDAMFMWGKDLTAGPVETCEQGKFLVLPVFRNDKLALTKLYHFEGGILDERRMILLKTQKDLLMCRTARLPSGALIVFLIRNQPGSVTSATMDIMVTPEDQPYNYMFQQRMELVQDCYACNREKLPCFCSYKDRQTRSGDADARERRRTMLLPPWEAYVHVWLGIDRRMSLRRTEDNGLLRLLTHTEMITAAGSESPLLAEMRSVVVGQRAFSSLLPAVSFETGWGEAANNSYYSEQPEREVTVPERGNNPLTKRTKKETDAEPRQKSLSCPNCGRIFGRRGHLNVHIRNVHDKVRNFACDMCDKKFSTRFNLLRHLHTVHNIEGANVG